LVFLQLGEGVDANTTYVDDDWYLFKDDVILEGGTWWVRGNVTLTMSHLIIENAELVIDANEGGSILVREEATLSVRNSTVRGTDHGVYIYIEGSALFLNSILYNEEQTSWDSSIINKGGSVVIERCKLGFGRYLVHSYSDLTIRHCVFTGFTSGGVFSDYLSYVKGNSSLVLEDSVFDPLNTYTDCVGIAGPADRQDEYRAVVRNCTFKSGRYPVVVSQFWGIGSVLVEDNLATGSDKGPYILSGSNSITFRHNRWRLEQSSQGFDIHNHGPGFPTIHNETITGGGYYGIRINGADHHVVLRDVNITGARFALGISYATASVHDSYLRATEYEISTTKVPWVRLYDCDHTRKNRISSQYGVIEDVWVVKVTKVTWQSGVPIEKGHIVFWSEDHRHLGEFEIGAASKAEIAFWRRTEVGSYAFHTAVASIEIGGGTFSSGSFMVKGLKELAITILDDSPPVIDVVDPWDGLRTQSDSIRVYGTYKELGSGLRTLRVKVDDGNWTEVDDIQLGAFAKTLDNLTDGEHNLHVYIEDLAGNFAEVSFRRFYTDGTIPFIEILTPAPLVNKSPIAFAFRTERGSRAFINNVEVNMSSSGVVLWNVHLNHGPNWINIRVWDPCGNSNYTSFHVILDMVPPFLEVDQPISGTWFSTNEIIVEGSAESDANVTINGIRADLDGRTFSELVLGEEGTFDIDVEAMDAARNHVVIRVRVQVDTVPPLLHVDPPGAGWVTKDRRTLISGYVIDNSTTTLQINAWKVPYRGITFSYAIDLLEGWNHVHVEAMDMAGNIAVFPIDVFRDSDRPAVEATLEVGGVILYPQGQRHLTTVDESKLRISISEDCLVNITGRDPDLLLAGTYTYNVPLEEDQLNTIIVTVEDKAGNHAGDLWFEVKVDVTPPHLAMVIPEPGSTVSSPSKWVKGQSEPGAIVSIAGETFTVSARGEFDQKVNLVEGTNSFHISARDEVGNFAYYDYELIYEVEPEGSPAILWAMATVGGCIAVLFVIRSIRARKEGIVLADPEPEADTII
jgi:hypothetical protein